MSPLRRIATAVLVSTLAAGATAAASEEKLGSVSFPNSCAEAAQPSLQRAVALLHSFWWEQADAAFADVRGYVEAIAAYYDRFGERAHGARLRSVADAFAALAQKYPDEDETQIFFALYLTATQSPTDKTLSRAASAAVILNQQFAKHPDHPGVAHYLIHSNDFPSIAASGLAAAMCYADIAPAAPHALHMPSHIFTRVGLWQQSADTNQRSVDAAKRANGITDQLHAYDYMVYAYLQLARDRDALRGLEAAGSLAEPNRAADYARAAIPARYAIERGAWREAAQLGEPDTSKFPYAGAIRVFARALGAARSGDPDAAERDLTRLQEIEAALQTLKEEYWVAEVQLQELAGQAWIASARGDRDRALALMRAAADKEDLSEKSTVSTGRLLPARELLGDMLLQNNRPADALREYEASLRRDPRRFRSYFGAGEAAAVAGNAAKAHEYFGLLVTMAGNGEPRPELAAVRDYLTTH